jgi:hypothetical protein
MIRSQHSCRDSMSAPAPALQAYSTDAMFHAFPSSVAGSGRKTVSSVCLGEQECLNYWNGFYFSWPRCPPVTQKTVASLRMAERCVCTFEREAAFKEAARPADDPPYTATTTVWNVAVTASNVRTLGVPSMILANVPNTSG